MRVLYVNNENFVTSKQWRVANFVFLVYIWDIFVVRFAFVRRRLCVPGSILANRLCDDVVNLSLIMGTWTKGSMVMLQIHFFAYIWYTCLYEQTCLVYPKLMDSQPNEAPDRLEQGSAQPRKEFLKKNCRRKLFSFC